MFVWQEINFVERNLKEGRVAGRDEELSHVKESCWTTRICILIKAKKEVFSNSKRREKLAGLDYATEKNHRDLTNTRAESSVWLLTFHVRLIDTVTDIFPSARQYIFC